MPKIIKVQSFILKIFHDVLQNDIKIAGVYLGIEIILFFLAFCMFMLLFSRIYRLFYDLVEVLLFFENVETQIIRQGNKSFLDMIEKTSSGMISSSKDSHNEFQSPNIKENQSKISPPRYDKESKLPPIDTELLNYEKNSNLY